MVKEQAGMKVYLEQKYGGEFTVETPHKEGYGLGVTGFTAAKAKQVGKNIDFYVGISSAGYYDLYQKYLWSSEQQPQIDSLVQSFNGTFDPKVIVSVSPSPSLEKSLGEKLPAYTQIRDSNGDQLSYQVDVELNINNKDYDNVVKYLKNNLPKLAQYIDEQKNGKSYLVIAMSAELSHTHYRCELSSETNDVSGTISTIDKCFKKWED